MPFVRLVFSWGTRSQREKSYRVNIREKIFFRTSSFPSHSLELSFLLAYSLYFFFFSFFYYFFLFSWWKPFSWIRERFDLARKKIKSLEYLASPRNYRRKNPILTSMLTVITRITCLSCHVTFTHKVLEFSRTSVNSSLKLFARVIFDNSVSWWCFWITRLIWFKKKPEIHLIIYRKAQM